MSSLDPIELKACKNFVDVWRAGPGGYTIDAESKDLIVFIPYAGVTKFNTSRPDENPYWRMTRDYGKVTLDHAIKLVLAPIRWQGRALPERELFHGRIADGKLVPEPKG